jgi:hypothetical protein
MAVQFGIVSSTTTYGFATSVERTQSVEEATYADADGDVKGYAAYNENEEITIEATYESTTPPPTIGSEVTLTIGGVSSKYFVTGIKDTETNDDYRKVSITAKRWITNTIPA